MRLVKNPLTYLGLVGIGIGALGFVYPASRRVILGIILLLCLGVVVSHGREKRKLRETLVMGLLMIPVVVATFFYRFAADLVFSTLVLFFGALLVLSAFQAVSERQKMFAAYFTFIGGLVAAAALNYRAIVQLVTGR